MRIRKCPLAIVLCLLTAPVLPAVGSVKKKSIDPEVYMRWASLLTPVLSDDGAWIAYTLSSANGESELVVRSTRSNKELHIDHNMLLQAVGSADKVFRPRGSPRLAQFSADSRNMLFSVSQITASTAQVDGSTLLSLGLLHLPDGIVTIIPRVASYSIEKGTGRYLAYTLETPNRSRTGAGPLDVRTGRQEKSTRLALRDLSTGSEVWITDVTEFAFDNAGRHLAYIVASDEREGSGVYLRRLADARDVTLLKQDGHHSGLTFDSEGRQLAFFSRTDQSGSDEEHSIYHVVLPFSSPNEVVQANALESGFRIDATAGLKFTSASDALVFTITSGPTDVGSASVGKSRNQQVQVDFWHWKDPGSSAGIARELRQIPSSQMKAPRYLALCNLKERRWVQLGRPSIPNVLLSDDGRFAVGISDSPYRLQSTWGRRAFNLYFIDVRSGASTVFRNGVHAEFRVQPNARSSHFTLSPTGRYLMYFEDERWWSVDLMMRKTIDLTGSLLPLVRFEHGYRTTTAPSGIAGWTGTDKRVLLHAQYDVWEIDPSGLTAPRNLTDGVGQRENIIFRLWGDYWDDHVHVSAEEQISDETSPLQLWAMDQDTISSGIWRDWVGLDRPPEPLLMLDKEIVPIAKAKQGQQYLVSIETYSEYPNLWSGSRFDQLRKVSNVNLHQNEYAWGDVELIEFTSDLGVPLRGLLYKPEGFDPSRQYPMVVSFYSRGSSELNRYLLPVVSGNIPLPIRFTSKDFLYFRPDIDYLAPYKLQSIIGAVMPAVRTVVDRGIVDPRRIGLIGFSFGGYEVTAIIAQTNLFRCAVNGAGLIDPISYYGGTQGFGSSFIETGQASHGGSIWEMPFTYIANSVLLYADRVQTPVLQMYNDLDHAVPFWQGSAFFFSLQRQGRPVWLVHYPGEGHGLSHNGNRLDWEQRTFEFFDYYLRDAPRPSWMQAPGMLEVEAPSVH